MRYASAQCPSRVQVGLGLPFATWLLPLIRQRFPEFPDRSAAQLYEAINVIKSPSFIRVEADEVRCRRAAALFTAA